MCVAAWKSLPARPAIGFFTTHPQMRRSGWVFPKGERGRHRAPSGRDVSSWMLLKDQLRENRDLYLDSHGVFVRKLQGYIHAASNGAENELAVGDYFFLSNLHRITQADGRHVQLLWPISFGFYLQLQLTHMNRRQCDHAIRVGLAPTLAKEAIRACRF